MMLIDIFGAAYGEATVISFEGDNAQAYGVVDCHPRGNSLYTNPIVRHLKSTLRARALSFVVATHPHEDHIHGLYQVIRAFPENVSFFGWWGGAAPAYHLAYYKQLEEQYRAERRTIGTRWRSIEALLDAVRGHGDVPAVPAHDTTDGMPDPFRTCGNSEVDAVRVRGVSPWLPEQSKYLRAIASGVHPGDHIDEHRFLANQTSIGLLIEYGEARVVLGGDVEKPNWDCAFSRGAAASLEGVHFIKLPHHGSATGSHLDMWSGKRRFVTAHPQATVAVATRYSLGRTELPDPNVLRQIADAGCDVWVVGAKKINEEEGSLINRSLARIGKCHQLSRFRATVHTDGTVVVSPGPQDECFVRRS